jgi:hypothetical protein
VDDLSQSVDGLKVSPTTQEVLIEDQQEKASDSAKKMAQKRMQEALDAIGA